MDRSSGWYWLSFVDGTLPKGEQFLGGCWVAVKHDPQADFVTSGEIAARRGLIDGGAERGPGGRLITAQDVGMVRAIRRAHELEINPGGEVRMSGPVPDEFLEGRVAPEARERLLNREEAESFA